MNLPFLSLFGKKEKKQYFLTLLLYEERAVALVFEEFLGKIKILGRGEEYFNTSSEEAPPEEWLEVLDKAISAAESALPPNIETQKTLFGIKESWVEGSKIKKEYLEKLKKLTDALGLLPVGFLVIPEAIAHLLKEEEGAPVSAVLVEVGKKNIFVSVLRAGRLLETKKTRIEDSVSQTTDRILHHFVNYEVLPSRILIFGGEDNEKFSQEFIAHAWSKSLPFLHVPKITVLSTDFDTKAVIFGAAAQMGFEVLEREKDIEEKETLTQDFGFVEEQDIAVSSQKEIPSPQEQPITVQSHATWETKSNPLAIRDLVLSLTNGAISILSRLPIKNIRLKTPNVAGRKIIFIPPLIAAFFLSLLLLYVFFLGATVVLTLDPKIVEKDQEVVFSTVSSTNVGSQTVSAEFVSTSQDGSTTVPATGKKEVGDKAKGEVTVYNSSLSGGKNFSKGTIITSSNNLDFTLDSEVPLASASGDASSIKPSSKKVSVTANDIGKEYNLPSGTKFTVDLLDQFVVIAKNDTAFSGGTKKEVTVVSKDDLSKATEEIIKNLEEKAKDEIARKISSGKAILPIFLSTALTKKEFSKDAEDEAQSVTLRATVLYQGISYKKDDLHSIASALLQNSLKEMVIAQGGIAYDVKTLKKKSEKEVLATLKIKSPLLPKLNSEKISQEIKGKTFEEAESILMKLPQAADVRISLHPGLPFLPKILPKTSKNIKLVVRSSG
ncbi:MAG: baseplate J/gp47 family protein [Candidatus Levybacteria bacterium]|nr:baseplate J/gp47 family protein [Candidatus Levybacteria bacterium]